MKYLNEIEIGELNKIKEIIGANANLDEIMDVCTNTIAIPDDKEFSFTYAACLLANQNRINEALQMFALNPNDTFSKILIDFLKDNGRFDLIGKVFKNAKPYHLYTQTPFYQKHASGVVENICEFAKNNPPPQSKELLTILDIGPGDGELIAKYVNELASLFNLGEIRLIFVDPFEEQLKTAAENCKRLISINCEVISICCKIQEITNEQMDQIRQVKPIWFVNAALSVHHMPKEQKIPMLKQMKTLSPNFILTEVNWNHDLPEKDSPELIYSVVKNYGVFCEDILNLPVSVEDRKLCLYHFPINEAINIIKQDRPHRIDYHTPIAEWKKIAFEAGYHTNKPKATFLHENDAFLFVMEFRSL